MTQLHKALVEFNLDHPAVKERFDITHIKNPCIVYLNTLREEPVIYRSDNENLPWVRSTFVFRDIDGIPRFNIIMEIPE